jgi:hypothetical protein
VHSIFSRNASRQLSDYKYTFFLFYHLISIIISFFSWLITSELTAHNIMKNIIYYIQICENYTKLGDIQIRCACHFSKEAFQHLKFNNKFHLYDIYLPFDVLLCFVITPAIWMNRFDGLPNNDLAAFILAYIICYLKYCLTSCM